MYLDTEGIFCIETKHCGYYLSCAICGLGMFGNRYQRIPSTQLPTSSSTYPKTVLSVSIDSY